MAGSPFYRAFVRLVRVQILRQVLEGAEDEVNRRRQTVPQVQVEELHRGA